MLVESTSYRPISRNGLRAGKPTLQNLNGARGAASRQKTALLVPKNDKTDCDNKSKKTHDYKTLPRPSANTRDRIHLSRRRVSVLSCARYKKDAPRDCGSMMLLDTTGRANYGEWMMNILEQKVMNLSM